MKVRITDISISQDHRGWLLEVPVTTGRLQLRLDVGQNVEIDEFLATVIRTPSRRFGESPE